MSSIRKVKTASGAIAVQVVRYKDRKVVVQKHIGSGRSKEEISALIGSAEAWLAKNSPQTSLFPKEAERTLALSSARYVGIRHTLIRTVLRSVAEAMGFLALGDFPIDLAIMRLIEPSSKLRAIELLRKYFGVEYTERTIYRTLPRLASRKAEAEKIAVSFAKNKLHDDLSIVLYDVTTLYFETFEEDALRVPGFSKDNKSSQPQIVVGLLVTREGFPVGYEVFKGNTFEGKTMLPVLLAFTKAHGVKTGTVVADAAMISRENVRLLEKHALSYIVGARLANASPAVIKAASKALSGKDGATTRFQTEHGDLICSFSAKRYRKDSAEMKKQIAKARVFVAKKEPGKRAKFVACANGRDEYALNGALVEKTTLLLGIKGYYTNIPESKLSDKKIIERYHDLWRVEKSFRIAKNDLETRPIFHRKEEAIRAHMIVCFIALAMAKYVEMASSLSLLRAIDLLWSVTDAKIIDTASGEEFILRLEISEDAKSLLKFLKVSY
jgi:transposase